MTKLSLVVVTLNEEANIEDCLATGSFADEIIVLDSESVDSTVRLAMKFTDKVYQKRFSGYGDLKREAVSRASGEWILSIDADERISPELAEEISEAIGRIEGYEGYVIPRKTYFLGRWIMHGGWYPGYVLRLFRRDSGEFTDSLVHECVCVDGKVGRLGSELLHYSDPSLKHYLWKLDRFTTLSAQSLFQKGRKTGVRDLLLRPAFTFLKMYVLRFGFLDGMQGLILSLLSSVHVLIKYVKLWELWRTSQKTESP